MKLENMITTILLLLFMPLTFASIEILINSSYIDGIPHVTIDYGGSASNIVSDNDTKSFGFDSETLLSAVEEYFYNRPTDVFLRSPTPPFGDLYKTYGWNQVQRILSPISVEVLPMTSQPIALLRQLFENNHSKPATVEVSLSETVEDKISSRWYKKKEIKFDAKASYMFNILMSEASAATEFKYNAVWGEDYEKTRTVSITGTSSATITLDPGQSVWVSLSAMKSTVKIEVEYESRLSGDLAVNYAVPYRGHHFWNMDVNKVCDAAGIQKQVDAKEEIILDYFWKGEVHINPRFL